MRVGLFVTCLIDMMRPEIGFSALKLLEAAGCDVVVPAQQTCCGQPGYNSGDRQSARALAEKFLNEFDDFDYVVVPSGSCGGMIKTHYADLFADDPELRGRLGRLAPRVYELTDFLHTVLKVGQLPEPQDRAFQGSITYHDSCCGLREMGVAAQPRALLAKRAGVALTEIDPHYPKVTAEALKALQAVKVELESEAPKGAAPDPFEAENGGADDKPKGKKAAKKAREAASAQKAGVMTT